MPQPAASKPVLAIDIDEVLMPFMEGFFKYQNTKFGTDFKITSTMPYHSAHQFIGDTVEQFQRKLDGFIESDLYRKSFPIQGAQTAVEKLKDRYQLVIVTARPATVRELTEDWVRNHFPETFTDVYFVPWVEDRVPDKQGSLVSLGAEILVDDNLSHIEEAVGGNVRGILFGDYPWNQTDTLPSGVTRAKTWSEVEEILL